MKIIFLDDIKQLTDTWVGMSSGLGHQAYAANSIPDAMKLIDEHLDADYIFLDACIPGDQINTFPLLKKAKRTRAQIIAISSLPEFNQELVESGAHHSINKQAVIAMLLSISTVSAQ